MDINCKKIKKPKLSNLFDINLDDSSPAMELLVKENGDVEGAHDMIILIINA